jgi:hypothetical protein
MLFKKAVLPKGGTAFLLLGLASIDAVCKLPSSISRNGKF